MRRYGWPSLEATMLKGGVGGNKNQNEKAQRIALCKIIPSHFTQWYSPLCPQLLLTPSLLLGCVWRVEFEEDDVTILNGVVPTLLSVLASSL